MQNAPLCTALCNNCEIILIFNRCINVFKSTLIKKSWKDSIEIRQSTIWYAGMWANGTNDSSTKCLMFQVLYFFFIKSCEILCKNPFNLFSNFFHKITKMKIMSFECPIRNCEKKNTWMSDACSTGCLFHRPNKPAYYIVDCRIFGGVLHILTQLGILPSPVMPNSSLPALNAFRIAKATLQPINIAGSPVAFDPKVPSFLFLRIIQLVYVSCIRLIWFRKKTLWFVAKNFVMCL